MGPLMLLMLDAASAVLCLLQSGRPFAPALMRFGARSPRAEVMVLSFTY